MIIGNLVEKDLYFELKLDNKSIIPSHYRTPNDTFIISTNKDIDLLKYCLDKKNTLYDKIKINSNVIDISNFLKNLRDKLIKKYTIIDDYLFSFLSYPNSNIIDRYLNNENFKQYVEIISNKDYLKEFQKVSVLYFFHKLLNRDHKRVLIGDDRGLGKTIVSLEISFLLNKYPIVVVCPSYLKYNWLNEIKKFYPDRVKEVYIFPKSANALILQATKKNIIILSYEILATNKKLIDILKNKGIKILILDECHYIKNPDANRTKAIISIAEHYKDLYIIGTTGTPIYNKPDDFYQLISFFYPNLFRNKSSFLKRYCIVNYKEIRRENRTLYIPQIVNYKDLEDLGKKVRTFFMIRRTKSKVLDQLPPKTRSKILIDIDEKEIKELNEEIYEMLKNIRRDKNFMELFSSLRRFSYLTGIYKIPYTIEFIKDLLDEGNNKIVVFFYHREVGLTLQNELNKLKIGNVLFIGGLNDQIRNRYIDLFWNNEDTKIFLGSIRACGLGINLNVSNIEIFQEIDILPATNLQAEDRCYRIGQDRNVDIYYPTIRNTIDEKMIEYTMYKGELFDKTLHEKENKIEFMREFYTDDFIEFLTKN